MWVCIGCSLDWLLPPFQIIILLTFLIINLTTHLIQKLVQKYHFFLLWFSLLIKVLQKCLKFDYFCTIFLNKTSGQT